MFEEKQPESLPLATGDRVRKKRQAHRVVFVNNCIVFKVQEFMYKNTVVLASAPQRKKRNKKENRRKAQTLGRRVRKQKQNTERRE